MKRANVETTKILITEDGSVFGLCLGGDFTAEHEGGIANILNALDVGSSLNGISRYAARKLPPLWHLTKGKVTIPATGPSTQVSGRTTQPCVYLSLGVDPLDLPYLRKLIKPYEACELTAAWDDKSFMVGSFNRTAISALNLIAEGAAIMDLAIFLAGGHSPFERGGLNIVRPSLMPAELKQSLVETHLDQARLNAEVETSGVVEALEARRQLIGPKASALYHALKPAWKLDGVIKGRVSSFPVMFFLNPTDQKNNNYGWFTVEEIFQWLQGLGPIVK